MGITYFRLTTIIAFLGLAFTSSACSHATNPLVPSDGFTSAAESSTVQTDNENLISSSDLDNLSGLGTLGVFEFQIVPQNKTASLIAKRNTTLGESFIVNGLSFFTTFPCSHCFSMTGISCNDGKVISKFRVEHPFPKGNLSLPPSRKNRLDLDLFDVALIVHPWSAESTHYELANQDIYSGIVANSDGYTNELAGLFRHPVLLPYVLVVDDSKSDPVVSTYNKFEMGTSKEFNVEFNIQGGKTLGFDLYLTFGFGVSATLKNRLDPSYFNPEFNRKAAWKVEVIPPNRTNSPKLGNTWEDDDNTANYDVTIKVWDWQIGAHVNIAQPDKGDIRERSDVAYVAVEIPGMNNAPRLLPGDAYAQGGKGTPDNPLVYTLRIANENLLPAGDYTGLVKVADKRKPKTLANGFDYLLDSPDGVLLEGLSIPEYATYQLFKATVVETPCKLDWAITWGGDRTYQWSRPVIDEYGNIYVTGSFYPEIKFKYGSSSIHGQSRGGKDIYLVKFDSEGRWLWLRTFGGEWDDDTGVIAIDNTGDIYIAGYFSKSAYFGGGIDHVSNGKEDSFLAKYDKDGNYIWSRTWGGSEPDSVYGIASDKFGNVYATGVFCDNIDLDPGTGIDQRISNGKLDIYLSKFDSNGNFIHAFSWGGSEDESAWSLLTTGSGELFIIGMFEDTVDFDPGPDLSIFTSYNPNTFISKFDENDNYLWTRALGPGFCIGYGAMASDNEKIYIVGSFYDEVDFDPGPGEENINSNGSRNAYLGKYDNNGNFMWVKTWGGDDTCGAGRIALDGSNNIYVIGWWTGTVDFDPGTNEDIRTSDRPYNFSLTRFDKNGDYALVRTWGGLADNSVGGVALDNSGFVYVDGYFADSIDLDPGPREDFHTASYSDGYLSKFTP